MTRKQKRLSLILSGLAILGIAAGLVLYALRDTIVFFYTPSEVAAKGVQPGQRLRLGGLVEKGSWKRGEGTMNSFVITDTTKTIMVNYNGQLPDLFREEQGVVAEGVLDASGTFVADTVLAKHDENYMPKDLADKLKEQGVWQETKGKSQ
ncbi:MAG: cytochrome c maturation protein CcmE [Alphaproteobacteria bacterium]|nr:cytochrome c maturation protein CcmE [Alphaproteobacteria bacterium]